MNPPTGNVASRRYRKPPCPKCSTPMENVSGWNWCSRCGHREEGRAPAAVMTLGQSPPPQSRSGAGTSELSLAFRVVPSWGWILIFGMGFVAAISFIADYNLPEKGRGRAIWSTGQVLWGLAAFLVTGVAVSGRLRAMRQSLSLSDILFPDRLWVLAVKNLPATRWYICTAVWTVMAVVCGIFWVGGLTYWLPSKSEPGAVKVPYSKAIVASARKWDEDPDDESKAAVAPPASAKPEKPKIEEPEEVKAPEKSVTKCVIVGYTMKDGELAGLLVSTVHGDELHFAGIVPASKDPEERKDLLKRFGALKADEPVFPDLEVQATWLKPRLSCEVESTGVDENQLLKDSTFKGLVFPGKPKPARPPAEAGEEDKDAKSEKNDGESKSAPDGKKPADTKDAGKTDRDRSS
jgi:hypothetical protein